MELVATDAINRPTLTRKKVMLPTTSPLQRWLPQLVRGLEKAAIEDDARIAVDMA
jgi:hypothetical protein